jgi:hypothetical protein
MTLNIIKLQHKKKSKCFISILLLLFVSQAYGQEAASVGKGEFTGKVFANFHNQFKGGTSSAFEIKRAYFGYKYKISSDFSASAKLDIGSPDDVSQYSLLRRYAYFKNAYLRYQSGKLKVDMGLIGLHQMKVQEKFWGYRYIQKTFQDEFDFGATADIGIHAAYTLNSWLSADLTMINGEGYKNLQRDDKYKYGMGFTIKSPSAVISRLYYDFTQDEENNPQNTYSVFIGYANKDLFRIGGEYVIKENANFKKERFLYGYSVYGTYIISDKIEVFGRYDQVSSNVMDELDVPWNLIDDGSAITAGIQYAPHKDIRFSVNYQDWVPYAANLSSERFIYLNLQFVF